MSELIRRKKSQKDSIDFETDSEERMVTEKQCIKYFKEYNVIDKQVKQFKDIDLKQFKNKYRKSTRLFHPDKKADSEKSKFKEVFEQMEKCKEMVNRSFSNILSDFFESMSNTDEQRLNFARSIFYTNWVHEGIEEKKLDNFRAVVFLEFLVVMRKYLDNGDKQLFIEESKRLSKLFFTSDLRRYFLPEGSKSAQAIISISTTAVVIHNWVFRQQLDFYVNDIIRTTSIIMDISTNNFMSLPGTAKRVAEMYQRIKGVGIILPSSLLNIENLVSMVINTKAIEEFLDTNSILSGFNSFSSFVKDNLGIDVFTMQVGYGEEAIVEAGIKGLEKDIQEIHLYIQMYIIIGIVLFVFFNTAVAVMNYRAYKRRVNDIATMITNVSDGNEQIEENIKELIEGGISEQTRPMIRRMSSESIEDINTPTETVDLFDLRK